MPIINFRVSDEEQEKIKIFSKKTNETVSQYVRKLALGEMPENIEKQKLNLALIDFWQKIDEGNYYSIDAIKKDLQTIILNH